MSPLRERLLRVLGLWSKWLKVDLIYFAKGGAWLTGGQVALSGLAMVSAVAFANLISAETFGHYRFILSIVGILGLSTLTGMDTALMRAASRGYEKTFTIILKKKMLWGLVGTVGALVSALYYFINGNTLLASALVACALFIPVKDPVRIYDALLQARRNFELLSIYRVIAQAVSITSLVVAMWLSDSLIILLLAYFIPVTILEIAIIRRTLRRDPLQGGVDDAAISYGYHLSFLRGVAGIAGNIQTVLLFHYLGPAKLAVFYFAQAPTEQARALIGHIETLLFPKVSQDDWHVGTFRAFFRKALPFLSVLGLGTIAYILIAPFVFHVLFPAYESSVLLSQLYAPTIIFTALNTVLLTIIKSKGSIKTQYILNAVDITMQLAVAIPLMLVLGLIGLVGAIALSKMVQTLLLMYRLFVYPQLQMKKTAE